MISVRFSYAESRHLKSRIGRLDPEDKDIIMSETSGTNNPMKTMEVPWDLDAVNNFLHSPFMFSGHEFHDNIRDKAHYKQTNVLLIDLDHDITLEKCVMILDNLSGKPAYHISFSSNHSFDAEHRLRVVMPLSEPITCLEDHALLALWVDKYFPMADSKVRTDVARGIIRSNCIYRTQVIMGGKYPLNIRSIIDEIYLASLALKSKENQTPPAFNAPAEKRNVVGKKYVFTLDTVIYTDKRETLTVQELMDRLSTPEYLSKNTEYQKIPIFCPVCGFDTDLRSEKNPALLKQNALIRLGPNKVPYINCQSCGSRKDGADKKGSYFLESTQQRDIIQSNLGFFVFRDIISDTYVAAYKSKRTNELTFTKVTPNTIQNFYYNRAGIKDIEVATLPDAEWVLEFGNDTLVDLKNNFVNRYQPNELWRTYAAMETKPNKPVPPYIAKLIHHIAGNDDQMYERFLDWLAYIVQQRRKAYIAFLFQGVQGIGKDFFFLHVIRAIFGEQYCASLDQSKLVSNFNAVLEDNVFLCLNEVQTDFTSKDANLVAARIKMLISDEKVEVERKHIDIGHGRNNVNVLLFSNQPNAVRLEASDRRFNVCPRQEVPLRACSWLPKGGPPFLVPLIHAELLDFLCHLHNRQYAFDVHVNPIENDAKARLMELTTTYNDEFFAHTRPGEIDWEWLELHISNDYKPDSLPGQAVAILAKYLSKSCPTPAQKKISWADYRAIYANITGKTITPQNFSHLLTLNNLTKTRLMVDGVRDYYVELPKLPRK